MWNPIFQTFIIFYFFIPVQQEEAAEEARIIAERALLAKKYTEEIERERRKGQGPAASQSADIVVAAPKPRVAAPSESEPAAVSDFRADLAAQRAADRQRKDAEARRRAEEEAVSYLCQISAC
jgi:hypothetical protein